MASKYFELLEKIGRYLENGEPSEYEVLQQKLSEAYRYKEINESSYASLSFFLQPKLIKAAPGDTSFS